MAVERPGFRPDIEGLRGIAILLVVCFHAGVVGAAGGFVGVDVFFVLSGFFITGILDRELGSSGTIDITDFYGKRAVRLLPPLFVVLLTTLAAAMWLYAPIDRVDIARTTRAVALYAGNIEFAQNEVNYFSSGASPLLHTWSLAVEEQFYFAWPLLLLVLAALVRRPSDGMDGERRPAPRKFIVGVAIVGAASFAASMWFTTHAQPWAFFGMPTRLWEFVLGGAIALTMTSTRGASRFSIVQATGLVGVAVAVALYDRGTPYPGMAALLPAFSGAALLIGGSRAPESLISRALSARWLRALGVLSYAWYLWHWPLIGIGGVLDPSLGVSGKLAWSAGGLMLAWLTHRFVEAPAREGRLLNLRVDQLAPAAFVASLVVALIAHGAMLAAARQAARPDQRTFAAARNDRMLHNCWATTVDEPRGACEFGDTRAKTTVVLFGDSHAEHWLGALDRIGKARGWKIVLMVKGGCPVAELTDFAHRRGAQYYQECLRYREAMVRRIVAMRPDAAILSSWDHYLPADGMPNEWQVSPEHWRDGLRSTYTRITSAGIPTIAIRGTPRTWFSVPECLSRRAAGVPFAQECRYDRGKAFTPAAVKAQTDAAKGLAVGMVDMNDQICASARCDVIRNGIIVFTDDNHLTASFSKSVAPAMSTRIDAALASLGRGLP